jgi:AraC-like DNA-binding protein
VQSVQHWATQDVPAHERFDYYANVLATAVTPMAVEKLQPVTFAAQVRATELGSISVLQMSGSAHRVDRGKREIARSEQRSFHLLINLVSPMLFTHRGRVHVAAGDAMLVDSQLGHRLDLPLSYDVVHLRLSQTFIGQWLPEPAAHVGRCLRSGSGWSSALCSFVRQLSPEFVARTSLPPQLVSDQIGALLALVANEMRGGAQVPQRQDPALHDRICDCITQRCTEFSLTAIDVARSLNVSARTLHRSLAANGRTFGDTLMAARVGVAMRMLTSQLCKRLTTAEIGRRAGFSDASHFARVIRRRVGTSPLQIRRSYDAGHRLAL